MTDIIDQILDRISAREIDNELSLMGATKEDIAPLSKEQRRELLNRLKARSFVQKHGKSAIQHWGTK